MRTSYRSGERALMCLGRQNVRLCQAHPGSVLAGLSQVYWRSEPGRHKLSAQGKAALPSVDCSVCPSMHITDVSPVVQTVLGQLWLEPVQGQGPYAQAAL